MKLEDIKVGMKVRLLGKHGCSDEYDNIEDWFEHCKKWEDVQRIKEVGYGVVKYILDNGEISIRDENETLFGWYFLPSDLEPYIVEHKFKIGDKVRVKNIKVDTYGSYGGLFVGSIVKYIGETLTIARVNKDIENHSYYYHLAEDDMFWCFAEEWLEIVVEEESLLPIGTKIRQIKPRFGMKDVLRGLFKVTKADNTHVFARYEQGIWIDCSITKQELEEYWEVVEEKKDEWEDTWHYCEYGQYKVHSNGKKVKVKIISGDVGVAICAEGDEFDLKKGIEIAKNRAIIKKLEKQIKKLCK